MASTKVMFPAVSQPAPESSAHPVALSVTADVHVYRCDDSQSSADESGSRVVVVTSLNAIIKGLSRTNVLANGDEYIAEPCEKPSVSFEIYCHPIVRKSNKGTCLNKQVAKSKLNVHSTISRMVLLPYLGCCKKKSVEMARQKKSFVKSSKTWEAVNFALKQPRDKRTRSQILNPPTGKTKLRRQSVHGGPELRALFDSEEFYIDDIVKSAPEKSRNSSWQNVRQSLSESQVLFQDERSRMYLCYPLENALLKKFTPTNMKESFKDRTDLGASLAGFEEAILTPPNPVRVKSTRNVSILHRPHTKSKATSTTSLDKYFGIKEKNLDESIKDVLMPYISARNYPSELLLKLVPKKQIEEGMKKDDHYEKGESTRISEDNLLTPKLDNTKTSKKSSRTSKNVKKSKKNSKKSKKKKCSLLCCFSKSNQEDSDDECVDTTVYYPSIVEVHEIKNTKATVKENKSHIHSKRKH